jgi:hypothetical protein
MMMRTVAELSRNWIPSQIVMRSLVRQLVRPAGPAPLPSHIASFSKYNNCAGGCNGVGYRAFSTGRRSEQLVEEDDDFADSDSPEIFREPPTNDAFLNSSPVQKVN